MAHAERRQVLRVADPDAPDDPSDNVRAVAGDGRRCVPGGGGGDRCGDGGPAGRARLAYPKGLAIAADETMYIADGRNVRVVTPDGKIDTLVGDQGHQVGDGIVLVNQFVCQ